jgi:hypothetical protein
MNCPKCNTKISDKAIARHLASKGGKNTTEAKKQANRDRINAYWADVRSGKRKRK